MLRNLINKARKYTKYKEILEKRKYLILLAFEFGMLYLNERQIIHRDLKPEFFYLMVLMTVHHF